MLHYTDGGPGVNIALYGCSMSQQSIVGREAASMVDVGPFCMASSRLHDQNILVQRFSVCKPSCLSVSQSRGGLVCSRLLRH